MLRMLEIPITAPCIASIPQRLAGLEHMFHARERRFGMDKAHESLGRELA
jgi:hypothetical protein